MLIITQHCFSNYRRAIFARLLTGAAGPKGRLLFGLNPPSSSVETYKSIEAIPPADAVDPGQYVMLQNQWLSGNTILWQSGLLCEIIKPDVKCIVFEGCSWHLSTWVGMFIARMMGKRVGLWTHGAKRPLRGLKRLIKTVFYRIPHFLLCYGSHGRSSLMNMGIPSQRIHPIHNCLDFDAQMALASKVTTTELTACRESLFKEPELPIFLWIGQLTKWRRLDLLLDALAKLRDEGFMANALFVGRGEDKAELQARAKSLGIEDRVVFYGACYEEFRIARLIMLSKVLVSPGPVGLSCIHAMTYGLPVLTSEQESQGPEIDAIIPGVTGDFFRTGDVQEMAAKMRIWAEAEHQVIRKNTQAIVRDFFSIDYQCAIYRKVLSGEDSSGWDWAERFKLGHRCPFEESSL